MRWSVPPPRATAPPMKRAWPLFASILFLAPALGGCSSNDPATDAGVDAPAPQDAQADTARPDAARDAGSDAAPADGGGDSGGPVDGGLACLGPSGCPSLSLGECCGQIVAAQGNPPGCFFSGTYSTQCKATCATQINPTCGTTSQMKVCEQKTDCTEMTYDQCCTVTINSQAISLCMSTVQAQLAGATCK